MELYSQIADCPHCGSEGVLCNFYSNSTNPQGDDECICNMCEQLHLTQRLHLTMPILHGTFTSTPQQVVKRNYQMPVDTVTENEAGTDAPALTETKARKQYSTTPEQKRASALRRDAAMLERLAKGSSDPTIMLSDAAKLRTQADALAPAPAKAEPRPLCAFIDPEDGTTCGAKAAKGGVYCFSHSDPVTKLSEREWEAVDNHFMADFHARLLEGFTWRQLKNIANPKA